MRRFFFLSILTLVFLASQMPLQAQSDEEAIKKVINELFEGMRTNDSAWVHKSFAEEVIFQRIVSNEDKSRINTSDFQNFLNAIGSPKEEVWDERIQFEQLLIDGDMAVAWTPYKFYRGEQFSHCGVNVFNLHKNNGKWQIFHLVDTSRTTDCPSN